MDIEKIVIDFTMKNARFKVKDNVNSQNVLGMTSRIQQIWILLLIDGILFCLNSRWGHQQFPEHQRQRTGSGNATGRLGQHLEAVPPNPEQGVQSDTDEPVAARLEIHIRTNISSYILYSDGEL